MRAETRLFKLQYSGDDYAFTSHRSESEILASIIYPATIMAALVIQWSLLKSEFSALVCAYVIALIAAIWITFLERVYPARSQWQPSWGDVQQDSIYMVAIQLAFPKLLGLSLVLILFELLPIQTVGLWPQNHPVWLQALLMLFAADFFRYWLHRAAHALPWLWKFHAVHHSPNKLYWLNVGRFHPVDKGFQFLLDTLPFILLGVTEEVIALYFAFYAVNGFFQHCNVKLKFGWLNYIVSSAELHRWHHSKLKKESDTNFGNNLIVWDWLFRTRFLPAGRIVDNLGLLDEEFPDSFLMQMTEPFKRKS